MSGTPDSPGRKILLVDDDRATLAFASRALERADYQVVTAEDGLRGIEAFVLHAPDLVLSDIRMPGLDGIALTRLIQAQTKGDPFRRGRYVPVMLFTEEDEPELMVEALGAGALHFIRKPFGVLELQSRVKSLLELVQMHRDVVAAKEEQEEEINLVKHLIGRAMEEGKRRLPSGFWMRTLATRRINGDASSYREVAPGVHYGCLLDAMGHGLVAAVSAMAMLEVFHALGPLGPSPGSLYEEMNRKHLQRFPEGRFSCAALFRLDEDPGRMSVLNAGLPLALLVRKEGAVQEIHSSRLPLGISSAGQGGGISEFAVRPGDRFFACSDGLSDLLSQGELERFLQDQSIQDPDVALRDLVRGLIGSGELHDDVSWVLWTVPPSTRTVPVLGPAFEGGRPLLTLDLVASPEGFDYSSLGPQIARFMGNLGLEPHHTQTLSVVLAEWLIKAVEPEVPHIHLRLQLQEHQGGEGPLHSVEVWIEAPGSRVDWRQVLAHTLGPDERPGCELPLLQSLVQRVDCDLSGRQLHFVITGA